MKLLAAICTIIFVVLLITILAQVPLEVWLVVLVLIGILNVKR
jgi:hypothetical protein